MTTALDPQTWETITTAVEKAACDYIRRIPSYSLLGYNDLYQAGMLGALGCLNRYNPRMGSLSTFLYYRINGEIKDLLRKRDHISRRHRENTKNGWTEPPPLSLDAELDNGLTLYDAIQSDSPDPANEFEEKERSARLWRALAEMSGRRKAVVALFMQGLNLREIGTLLGVSESRVFQIQKAIFSTLKRYLAIDQGHHEES